jgi:hypothetical protein
MIAIADEPDDLSTWWWLGLPAGLLVALGLLGQVTPTLYGAWIHGEQGLLEMAQFLVSLGAAGVGVALLFKRALQTRPALLVWVATGTAGCLYIAGEEVSWGQHLFHWTTPEYWSALNDQHETNLHNVSSWLDQKPRSLLELGVVVGGILLPIAALHWPHIRTCPAGIIIPPFLCLPSAVLAEVTRLSERVAEWTGGDIDAILVRPSEYQELYFYLFLLFYMISLGKRLEPTTGAP